MLEREKTEHIQSLVPYLKHLGFEIGYQEQNLVFRLPFSDKLIGNTKVPAIHGGVIGCFSQESMRVFSYLKLELPHLPRLVDFSLDYLLMAKSEAMYAQVNFIKTGKRISALDCKIWQEDFSKLIISSRANILMI